MLPDPSFAAATMEALTKRYVWGPEGPMTDEEDTPGQMTVEQFNGLRKRVSLPPIVWQNNKRVK